MKNLSSVPGYPSVLVDDCGNVYDASNGQIKKTHNDGKGYLRICIKSDGVPVHKLVCLAFHGPKPSPIHQVRHKDGVKTNNVPSNVVWGTPKEDAEDRIKHGRIPRGETHPYFTKPWLKPKGEKNGVSKLTDASAAEIKLALRRSESRRALAIKYAVHISLIHKIATNKNWTHVPWPESEAA